MVSGIEIVRVAALHFAFPADDSGESAGKSFRFGAGAFNEAFRTGVEELFHDSSPPIAESATFQVDAELHKVLCYGHPVSGVGVILGKPAVDYFASCDIERFLEFEECDVYDGVLVGPALPGFDAQIEL